MILTHEIEKFHTAFGLPMPARPQPLTLERTVRFKEILQDELNEVDDILTLLRSGAADDPDVMLDAQVMMADWLGDLIVYCASEAARHGIPLDVVLSTIFQSNMSKLDENGKAIIANGKVQKGPNYWKPEPMLRSYLATAMGV